MIRARHLHGGAHGLSLVRRMTVRSQVSGTARVADVSGQAVQVASVADIDLTPGEIRRARHSWLFVLTTNRFVDQVDLNELVLNI